MQADWQQWIDQTVQDKSLRRIYAWEPFAKGSSNAIFLGRLKQSANTNVPETVILRLNAPAKDVPGVNRRREADILNVVKSYHWAPQVIRNEPEQGWCLMPCYAPIALDQAPTEYLPRGYQKKLLEMMNELQAITISSGHVDLQTNYQVLLNETYLPIAQQRQNRRAHVWIQSIKESLATLPLLPACLVHHDIHMGNLVTQSNTNLILLDWEYAAVGNPWFDASCLSRYLSIPANDIHALALFSPLNKACFNTALKQANSMTETLEKMWHWARE